MNSLTAKYLHRLQLAGVGIDCLFCFPETISLFGSYYLGPALSLNGACIPKQEWEQWFHDGGSFSAAAEFTSFTACASDALLRFDRAIMHAVSFSFRGNAWLLTAASGVGKSTQIRTLQQLHPGEFSVICGDRTILELCMDGKVMAHPSPWNGKEGWHGAEKAPLAGILCLERGDETSITRLPEKDAVFPILYGLISTFATEETVHLLAAFENELIKRVPIYRFVNGGVPDSSKILYEQLLCKMENSDEI